LWTWGEVAKGKKQPNCPENRHTTTPSGDERASKGCAGQKGATIREKLRQKESDQPPNPHSRPENSKNEEKGNKKKHLG